MEEFFCHFHKDVETRLGCSSCGRGICPNCMVEAAIGFKCPECARGKKTHIEEIALKSYLTGGFAGIVIGAGAGYIWYTLSIYGVMISLLAAYAVGFCISRAITLSIGNKIGLKIQIFAGVITFVSMAFNPIIFMDYILAGAFFPILVTGVFSLFSLIKLLAIVIAVWAAIRHFKI